MMSLHLLMVSNNENVSPTLKMVARQRARSLRVGGPGFWEIWAVSCWINFFWLSLMSDWKECHIVSSHDINSLAPGRFERNFRYLIFQIISVIDGWGISCKIALRWMPLDLTDDKSTLVQVMDWCRQAINHYMSQWWPRFMSPYGVTRPQWVQKQYTD